MKRKHKQNALQQIKDKDLKAIVLEVARHPEWRFRVTGEGHLLFYPPDKEKTPISVASTPSDRRAAVNARTDFRRAGFRFADEIVDPMIPPSIEIARESPKVDEIVREAKAKLADMVAAIPEPPPSAPPTTEEEKDMVENRVRKNTGMLHWVRDFLKDHPGEEFDNEQLIQAWAEHRGVPAHEVPRSSISGALGQLVQKGEPVERLGRGMIRSNYPQKAEAPVSPPTPGSVTVTNPPAPAPQAPAPQPAASSNGTHPDVLSWVSALDGGKVLLQGDDGDLYVAEHFAKVKLTT